MILQLRKTTINCLVDIITTHVYFSLSFYDLSDTFKCIPSSVFMTTIIWCRVGRPGYNDKLNLKERIP